MEEINQKLEELLKLVNMENNDAFRKELFELIEVARNVAFIDGYEYAIEVLKEGIVK